MLQPNMGNRPDLTATPWAADNGCFSGRFDLPRFIRWLEKMQPYQSTCLFAVAPDVVGDAAATLERSRDVLPMLRTLGYPAAFVAQDGLEDLEVPWDSFDALFIGGTTDWKLSETAYAIAAIGASKGKWLHMGRVNSMKRWTAARISGFDSVDGTYLKFGPNVNLPKLLRWVRSPQMHLGQG